MGKGGSGPRHKGVEGRGDSIRIRFKYRGRRTETLRLEPTTANLKYASQLRGEIQRKITLGTFRYADYFPDSKFAAAEGGRTDTFRDVAQAWLAGGELAKATKNGYRKILEGHLYPVIGDEPMTALTYLKLLPLLANDSWEKKTRNNVLICIRRPFDIAFTDGLIQVNPAARLKYLRVQVPPPDPFEPAEVEDILAGLEERYGEQPANYAGVGFFVGPRPSELIAMAWPDMDWRSKILRIQRALVLHEEKDTKTARVRDHELAGRALYFLERQRSHTQLRGPSVFLDPVTGKTYNDDKPFRERYWRPTLTALKIRYRVPYQMRHTYATMAIMAKRNPAWIARQMGNSPQIMWKHYGRWLEAVDRGRERDELDKYLGQIWGKSSGDARGNAGGSTE